MREQMPDEPNKEMDEMLRAYAEERRKAADLELHPVTRNLLLGEVKRVFAGGTKDSSRWQRLRVLWPQLAFAGGSCIIFAIALLSLREPSRIEQSSAVAQPPVSELEAESVQKKEAADLANEFRSTPAAASEETQGLTLNDGLSVEKNQSRPLTAEQMESVAAPPAERILERKESLHVAGRERVLSDESLAPSGRPPEVQSLQKQKRETIKPQPNASSYVESVTRDSAAAPTQQFRATSAGAASAVAAPTKLARSVELTNLGAARRLNFIKVADIGSRGFGAQPDTGPILTSFQVEQFGTNVRVLDLDGSVYVGALEVTNRPAIFARKDDAAKINSSAAYNIRVQGTNRTLGKDLFFSGQYFEQTNPTRTSLDTFGLSAAARPAQTGEARHLIIGNAVVGTSTNVPVRAVSSGP